MVLLLLSASAPGQDLVVEPGGRQQYLKYDGLPNPYGSFPATPGTSTWDTITVKSRATLFVHGDEEITVRDTLTVELGGEVIFVPKTRELTPEEIDIYAIPGKGTTFGRVSGRIIAENVLIEAGGAIHSNGQGYMGDRGWDGAGLWHPGGSHGGLGFYTRDPERVPPTYGSVTEPTAVGLGGGWNDHMAYGGGAVRLIVNNTLTNNGRIGANGGLLPDHKFPEGQIQWGLVGTFSHSAGGAGGSVWISTGVLEGNGLIEANGDGTWREFATGSGGGRVAVYYEDATDFDLVNNLRALPTLEGDNGRGQPQGGTVYLENTANGERHLVVGGRIDLPEVGQSSAIYDSVTVLDTGLLQLGEGMILTVNGAIHVQEAGQIVAQGHNNEEKVDGEWMGEGATIIAESVTIDEGGAIHADGQGYFANGISGYFYGGGPGGYLENGNHNVNNYAA
ncbi:MAG TPA: hypothetical protein VJ960_07060, partial [Oceanipulchritudo sp.]|nr:hypothetical protein [Oceanipulchritudo sp.]